MQLCDAAVGCGRSAAAAAADDDAPTTVTAAERYVARPAVIGRTRQSVNAGHIGQSAAVTTRRGQTDTVARS